MVFRVLVIAIIACSPDSAIGPNPPGLRSAANVSPFRGALLRAVEIDEPKIRFCKEIGANSVALVLGGDSSVNQQAIKHVRDSGLALCYWIEVGRNPNLAEAHPEWMASLQGHPEWRRLFPNCPKPTDNEVVKNYPWVPIAYKESFNAHINRIRALLKGLPTPA